VRPEVDFSDARLLAADLYAAGPEVVRKVRNALTRNANSIAKNARANAPKDRPWLSTPEGIKADTRGLSRRIYSPPDERGRPVGLFVEIGTSVRPPQPFLVPALQQQEPAFVSEVDRIMREAL
jgi:HK97 gp10 family phage protein